MAIKTVRALNGGNNNHPEPVFTANSLATDFMSAGVVGVISLNTGSGGTGAFAVNAQTTPTMSVRIGGPSVAYVTAIPTGSVSQLLRVDMNTFEDVTISANSSGSTKFDWIYIKVDPDLALNPDASATTVITLVTSRSTSSSTDNGTPPTYGYCLAVITVANGASSITNSNIADKRAQAGAVANSVVAGSALVGNSYNPYKFSVYLSVNQAVSNGTTAIIAFDTREFDTSSNVDIVANKGRFTAPIAGFYKFNFNLQSTESGGSLNQAVLYKNGSIFKNGTAGIQGAGTSTYDHSGGAFVQLAANDYVEVAWTNTTGAAKNVNGNQAATYFEGFLVSQT